ncbi:MAG: hypothetical protein H7Y60_00480 [Rhodospirillaceae bacterium]|nr:hypothetical protein [Rhodospirillales bacterium]
MAQALLLSRRCRIAVEGGMVHVQQRHLLFAPLTMSVPLSEYQGVYVDRRNPLSNTGWSVLLAHSDASKIVPLAWRRRYRASALGVQVVEMAADRTYAFPGDAIDFPLARKVARGLLTVEAPGPRPVDLSSEVVNNGCAIQFAPKQRLVLAEGAVVLETRRFGAWSPRWRAALADLLSVHMGAYHKRRHRHSTVVVRTADGWHFAGPCPSEDAARWLKASIIGAAVA